MMLPFLLRDDSVSPVPNSDSDRTLALSGRCPTLGRSLKPNQSPERVQSVCRRFSAAINPECGTDDIVAHLHTVNCAAPSMFTKRLQTGPAKLALGEQKTFH
eukprot:3752092-Amphidinium_carterae.2